VTEYARTREGRKVHRAGGGINGGCTWSRNARTAVPWRWADGKDFEQLVAEFTATVGTDPDISLCGHCFTLFEQTSWWSRVQQGGD